MRKVDQKRYRFDTLINFHWEKEICKEGRRTGIGIKEIEKHLETYILSVGGILPKKKNPCSITK